MREKGVIILKLTLGDRNRSHLEIINRQSFTRLVMGHINRGIAGVLAGLFDFLFVEVLTDAEFLFGINQIRVDDLIPVGLKDQGPLEIVMITTARS